MFGTKTITVTNNLVLSVVVGKLMRVAMGIALVDPTHRYTRLAPHLTPRPLLRSVTAVTAVHTAVTAVTTVTAVTCRI